MSAMYHFPFGSPAKKETPKKKVTTVKRKKPVSYGLNAAEQAVILPYLQYHSEPDAEGLNAAVSPDEIYSYITDLIINTINTVGHLPWQKEWVGSGSGGAAKNYVSKKEYTGANFILNFDIKFDEKGKPYLVPIQFIEPYYLTFNQIKEAKATLKKGSKAHRVIYYTMIFDYDSPTAKIKTTDQTKFNAFVKANNLTSTDLKQNLSKIPVLKYYNVFRADDCTGLKFPSNKDLDKIVNPIDEAQKIIDGYKNPPAYTFAGDRAFYQPSGDILNMPNIKAFSSEAYYYATFFHEMTHSTGAEKRLKRDFSGKFGSKNYAFEELIAELGAVFLCSESGILFHVRENSAKYLQSWNRKLVNELENDNRFFLKASAQAQKATNHILGREQANTETTEATEKKEKPEKVVENHFTRAKRKKTVADQKKTGQLDLFEGLNGSKAKSNKQTKIAKKRGQLSKKPCSDYLDNVKRPPLKSKDTKKVTKIQIKTAQKTENVITNKASMDKNSLAYKMANQPKYVAYFDIPDMDIARILGKIEKKSKESVFISLTGGEGSMKTRMAFQLMNTFAQNYKVGHASIEEHPESVLYFDKAKQYLNTKAQANITNPEVNSLSSLHQLILKSDVVVIDSFTKMKEIEKSFEVDKDLRKKYDGKLFIVIFQQTTDGSMRGGSKSQFDADVVLFTEKFDDYKQNYIYSTKNRYSSETGLKFNIFQKQLQGKKAEVQSKTKKLSFKVK